MIDDPLSLLSLGIWLMAAGMYPLGFLFGACSACCDQDQGCDPDGLGNSKPSTDPSDEGTWLPVTPWPNRTVSGVVFPYAGIGVAGNWSFVDRETHGPGNTWYFFGSSTTSKRGGGATTTETRDWGNLCNWYSAISTNPPSVTTFNAGNFLRRATRLPDEDAVVHIYTLISTELVGPQVVKAAYFWSASGLAMTTTTTEITATGTIFSNDFVSVGMLFHGGRNFGVLHGGAAFIDPTPYSTPFSSVSGGNGGNSTNFPYNNSNGVVNGGAVFSGAAFNWATVNDGAEFITRYSANRASQVSGQPGHRGGTGVVNGGAVFRGAVNQGGFGLSATINGGAVFYDFVNGGNNFGTVNNGAEFNGSSFNGGTVNDGAVFNDFSTQGQIVNGGAIFNDSSRQISNGTTILSTIVNGGAEFFDTSRLEGNLGTVNDGATFNDAACSKRVRFGVGGVRFFVAHPTDFPICNGTAPPGSDLTATCGCN